MPDIPSAAAAIEAAAGIGGVGLFKKILGPSADRIGDALARYTDYRIANTGRILAKARRKLGDHLNEAGEVHPRVAKQIIDEGSWCDDDVVQEYFAGVLAASRSEIADDRGAMWAGVIAGLSAYQVRTHYVAYRALRELGRIRTPAPLLGLHEQRQAHHIYLPGDEYAAALGLDNLGKAQGIATHTLVGLRRVGLIGWQYAAASPPVLRFPAARPDVFGLEIEPETPGIELYLWGNGIEFRSAEQIFFEDDEVFEIDEPVPPIPGAMVA